MAIAAESLNPNSKVVKFTNPSSTPAVKEVKESFFKSKIFILSVAAVLIFSFGAASTVAYQILTRDEIQELTANMESGDIEKILYNNCSIPDRCMTVLSDGSMVSVRLIFGEKRDWVTLGGMKFSMKTFLQKLQKKDKEDVYTISRIFVEVNSF